jgi:hypothetical protein
MDTRKFNPYSIVLGKLPTQKEWGEWSNKRWVEWLQYVEFFIQGEGSNEVFRTTKEKMLNMEGYLDKEDHHWHEFIYRVNLFADTHTPRQFYYKFQQFVKNGLTYLKKHPSLITSEVDQIIQRHPGRMGWCLKQYVVKETASGQEIVTRENIVVEGFKKVQTAMPSIQAKMMSNTFVLADLVERLGKTIKDVDIKKISPAERLKLYYAGMSVLQNTQKKNQSNHFTQINLGGDVRDLEKQSLAFLKKKNENE